MQFQKGQSGNPAGRPRGSQNRASIRMQEMLEQKAEQLVNKVVEMAIAGNIGALRLCLDRLVPVRRNEALPCELPPLAKTGDAVAAIAAITSAAVAGDVTADEAAKLAKVISLYVNTLEAQRFEDQLVKLERADLKRVTDMSHASNDPPVNDMPDADHEGGATQTSAGAGATPQ
jgi:hypothetical protein